MPQSNKAIVYWLATVCLTIFAMIVVGGITRLTDSGLSMVEWRPLLGTLPPLNEAEWQRVFTEYKNYPQYQLVNAGMTLDAFKSIFFWEYGHRLLGRMIGVLFAVPFFYFLIRGQIAAEVRPKLWVALVLGSLQGLMGWYMVKSGLVNEPMVSHFRLAAHLCLALFLLAYIAWVLMDLVDFERVAVTATYKRVSYVFLGLVVLQIVYGAFVAGNRAGYGFNTYPLMNGSLLPDVALSLSPFWHNLFDNNAMLQFIHRWLGAFVLVAALCLHGMAMAREHRRLKIISGLLLGTVILQFLLGVMTLLSVVDISLASIHQAGACVVVLVSVGLIYSVQSGAKA